MSVKVDPITLDIIENALKNARFEMDGVVVRISLSPVIREQHDEFPMICNERGQMVVGQFGSYIPAIVQQFENDINDGDIFVWNDPYACKGIVPDENVAVVDIIFELLDDGRDVGAELSDNHLPALVADHRKFVVLLADDGRKRDADHDAVHLEAGVLERVLDNVERDGIDLNRHGV